MSTILEARNLEKSFGKKKIFSGLNLSLEKNKITVLYGKSGLGKTTLLKCLTLLESVDAGDILVEGVIAVENGKIVNEQIIRDKVGIVFQDFYLWDNKKVLENITEGLLYVKKLDMVEATTIAEKISQELGLHSEFLNKYPPELSRGQRQRVAIARTLAMNPDILLFDEPTASLDKELVDHLSNMIKLLRDTGKTILIVSHDTLFIEKVADITVSFRDLQTQV